MITTLIPLNKLVILIELAPLIIFSFYSVSSLELTQRNSVFFLVSSPQLFPSLLGTYSAINLPSDPFLGTLLYAHTTGT